MASRLAATYASDTRSRRSASRSSAVNALIVVMPPRFPDSNDDRSATRSRTWS
jgi:hypothetical protein